MAKRGKKYTSAAAMVDLAVKLPLNEALALAAKTGYAKFDESVDVAIRLGVNPRHADQMVRGACLMPKGLGKTVRVLVFAKGEKEKESEEAGAYFV